MLSVLLLSSKSEIIAVLRTFRPHVPEGGDPSRFQVYETGAKYANLERHFFAPTTFEPITHEGLEGMLRNMSVAQEEAEEEEVNALLPQGDTETTKKKKPKKKKDVKYTLRKALINGAADYGAQLVEEVIRSSGVDGNRLVSQVASQGTPSSS